METIMLPDTSRFDLTSDLRTCRILNGLWQVSGGHGVIDSRKAIMEMFDYHAAGFTTWDLADHYGPAEDFIGEFQRQFVGRFGAARLGEMQAFTKWVPRPGPMTRAVVERAVGESLGRMKVETLDLLQFHWWEYGDRRYLDALKHLADLRDEGRIKHLALTNFDTEHLRIITENGIKIISNQVQYSIVDRRPEIGMAPYCSEHGIRLLTYGTVLGGLLAEEYLGQPEPRSSDLSTASLRKYKSMIDAWGGWLLFQELLTTLKHIGDKHEISIANVGVRYILDRPTVAGVIIGARLGIAEHIAENARVFSCSLDEEDRTAIDSICAKSRDLFASIGECGDEYR
jgi:aryl-alcohol dehydrogenase-like predicted oxidoreductase